MAQTAALQPLHPAWYKAVHTGLRRNVLPYDFSIQLPIPECGRNPSASYYIKLLLLLYNKSVPEIPVQQALAPFQNDQYGHEVGDAYLKETGRQFLKIGTQKSIIARQGGDEFVLFLYEYSDEAELVQAIKELEYLQSHTYVDLGNQAMVQIKFSFGYEMKKEPTNYRELLKCADEKMYQNKKIRKNR